MATNQNRLQRERQTIRVMIEMYCRDHHRPVEAICTDCEELTSYAMQRIDKCPFQSDKPTCAKCPIHCYKPAKREQVRQVMRYAGPRMVVYHPILAILHFIDEKTKGRAARRVERANNRAR